MKRFAFVSTMEYFPWGGSEELWSGAALSLARDKYEVGVYVQGWAEKPARIKELEAAGCSMVFRKKQAAFLENLKKRLGCPWRWLDVFKPDLLVISQAGSFDGLPWMRACARRGIPFATIAQAAAPAFWPHDAVAAEYAALLKQARAAYFVSRANLELVRDQLNAALEKAEIVRNPFNVAYDVSIKWPEKNGAHRWACVARLQPHAKGQDLLFSVLAREKWRQRPLAVTLFGEGPQRGTLEGLAKRFGLERVRFAGHVENPAAIWESHEALILPSRFEGLPLSIVEAMLCGRPAIVTDAGGNAELLEDNVTGFVARAAEEEFLDEAMERAWQRREDWREMGTQAAARVRERVPEHPAREFAHRLKALLA